MTDIWRICFRVNGQAHELEVAPLTSLAQILRDNLGLTGTKIGCNDGECGACTVIVDGKPMNSCLILAPQIEGADVQTIESVESNPAYFRI